jgi:hypothetical protein
VHAAGVLDVEVADRPAVAVADPEREVDRPAGRRSGARQLERQAVGADREAADGLSALLRHGGHAGGGGGRPPGMDVDPAPGQRRRGERRGQHAGEGEQPERDAHATAAS